MTDRENYLVAARGGRPQRVPIFPDDCNVFSLKFWKRHEPETGMDCFNIKWVRDAFGTMPDPKWRAMDDISKWRETAHPPKLSELDWEGMAKEWHETKDPNKVDIAMLNTMGIFLIPVNMMGWETALCSVLEEPEEMEAFVGFLTDYLLEILDYYDKYIHPDIVFTGDDFAGGGGPFFAIHVFREMFAPYLKKICDRIHRMNALAEFHCCGNCQYLIRETLEMGYDIFQLAEPNAQLERDKKEFGNKLVMTGGWDRRGPGNVENAPEAVVRESVHTAIDTYGKDGGLIFWDGGIIGTGEDTANKKKWIYDEVRKYGSVVYRKELQG